MYWTASNETTLVSEIPIIINEENVIIAPGQRKTPVLILKDEFYEEPAFPDLLPKGKFGYNVPWDIPISPARYFNQRLLNFNQYFASDADSIFFARSGYEQHHLRSTINFAMHEIKPGTLTAAPVKSNFKGRIERFVASDNVFSFMSSVKGATAYSKQFLYDVLIMVKQLGIRTYFLTLSCADLRWEELLYTINRLNNLGLSEDELKNLSYQEQCNLLNNNSVLVARNCHIKLKHFSKRSYLMVHWAKQNIMQYVLNFKKEVAHLSILLYGFSMHQIFIMQLTTSTWENSKCTAAKPIEWYRTLWVS